MGHLNNHETFFLSFSFIAILFFYSISITFFSLLLFPRSIFSFSSPFNAFVPYFFFYSLLLSTFSTTPTYFRSIAFFCFSVNKYRIN